MHPLARFLLYACTRPPCPLACPTVRVLFCVGIPTPPGAPSPRACAGATKLPSVSRPPACIVSLLSVSCFYLAYFLWIFCLCLSLVPLTFFAGPGCVFSTTWIDDCPPAEMLSTLLASVSQSVVGLEGHVGVRADPCCSGRRLMASETKPIPFSHKYWRDARSLLFVACDMDVWRSNEFFFSIFACFSHLDYMAWWLRDIHSGLAQGQMVKFVLSMTYNDVPEPDSQGTSTNIGLLARDESGQQPGCCASGRHAEGTPGRLWRCTPGSHMGPAHPT